MKKLYSIILFVGVTMAMLTGAMAGKADVVGVKISPSGGGSYRFDVTVRHNDTGWDEYADRWEVLDAAGNILGTRVLFHPHVDEQPFTRSLSGVKIPSTVKAVTIRAHDSVHKFGGKEMTVKVPR